MRLSPFDLFPAYYSFTLGHFHRGRFEGAANAAYKGRPIQSCPQFLPYAAGGTSRGASNSSGTRVDGMNPGLSAPGAAAE